MTSCNRRRIGDTNCHVTSDCRDSVENSHCSAAGECVCDVGFVAGSDDGFLCRLRRLGDNSTCRSSNECEAAINKSRCFDQECVCQSGYMYENDYACRLRKIFDTCDVMSDCSDAVPVSYCAVNGSCLCTSGYAVDYLHSTCNRRKIGDANCFIPTDCTDVIPESNCVNGTCLCNPGYAANETGSSCLRIRIGGFL